MLGGHREIAYSSQSNELQMFVGGLSSSATNEELYEYFLQFGRIAWCQVQVWKNNPQKCRGFAILQPEDNETFSQILAHTHRLKGRLIECKRLIRDKDQLNSYSQELIERKIYVSGLAKDVGDNSLKVFFSQFGPVEMAYIIKHHKDSKSKGFGFVSFYDKADKDKVLALPEIKIGARVVRCSSYCPKTEREKENSVVHTAIPLSLQTQLLSSEPGDSPIDLSIPSKHKLFIPAAHRPERAEQYVFRRRQDYLWSDMRLSRPITTEVYPCPSSEATCNHRNLQVGSISHQHDASKWYDHSAMPTQIREKVSEEFQLFSGVNFQKFFSKTGARKNLIQ